MRQGNVQAAVDQANLLSGVRNDIESVLPCQSLLPGLVYLTPEFLFSAYKSSAAEALLVERGRIDSSHQMMDDTIEYVPSYFLVAPTNRRLQSSSRDTRRVWASTLLTRCHTDAYGGSAQCVVFYTFFGTVANLLCVQTRSRASTISCR